MYKVLSLIKPLPLWRPKVLFHSGRSLRIIFNIVGAISFAFAMIILLIVGVFVNGFYRKY